MFNFKVSSDWFEQAKRTLKSASNDEKNQDFNWACFKAQQATEFGLKSLLYGIGIPAFGHSVKILADIVSKNISTLIFDQNQLIFLDKMYIPTRYADAFPGGSPFSFYTQKDATDAIDNAQKILDQIDKYIQIQLSTVKSQSSSGSKP